MNNAGSAVEVPFARLVEEFEGVLHVCRKLDVDAFLRSCVLEVRLQHLDERTFDVVITDILMPERDGLETLQHTRKTQPDAKVIAITGAANDLYLDNARGLGASRVFQKPFKLKEIAAAVKELTST